MKVLYNLDELINELNNRNPVITIGNFDGLHLGHQKVLENVIREARLKFSPSIVITFEPHPIEVINPSYKFSRIYSLQEKIRLLKLWDIDFLLVIEFTKDFAEIQPREFVRNILVDKLNVKTLIVGYDFNFGRGREGGPELLGDLGDRLCYGFEVVDPVMVSGGIVKSSNIRRLIRDGKFDMVNKLLGRAYQIVGSVGKGVGRGQSLGVPTANLEGYNCVLPGSGVYAVMALSDNRWRPAVMNIGNRPTFGGGDLSAEVHILDFDGALYRENIRVAFIEKLRDEIYFSNTGKLKSQIKRDMENARELLSKVDQGLLI